MIKIILKLFLLIATVEWIYSYHDIFNELETILHYVFWWFLIGLLIMVFVSKFSGKG